MLHSGLDIWWHVSIRQFSTFKAVLLLLGLKVIFGYLEVRDDTIMILGGLNISISIDKKKIQVSVSVSIRKNFKSQYH